MREMAAKLVPASNVSELAQRLARRWQEDLCADDEVVMNGFAEDDARWWLNAIADELERGEEYEAAEWLLKQTEAP